METTTTFIDEETRKRLAFDDCQMNPNRYTYDTQAATERLRPFETGTLRAYLVHLGSVRHNGGVEFDDICSRHWSATRRAIIRREIARRERLAAINLICEYVHQLDDAINTGKSWARVGGKVVDLDVLTSSVSN